MTMKKIFSILSIMLMFVCCNFALTSCSNDDDDDTNEDKVINKLVGTWKDTTYAEGFEYGFTFNADGTYSYYTKCIEALTVFVTDKEGYLLKHKGTYTVSEDELILKQEYGYYPNMRNNPDAEWEKDARIGKIDIEWLENNKVIRLNPHDDMPSLELKKTE